MFRICRERVRQAETPKFMPLNGRQSIACHVKAQSSISLIHQSA
ncbi:oligopeptide ABC transporter, ATP-binding protein [Vibrio parahaemolyticus AQ3810]|nr:oligopeptide ABC transporter, ATP-binding protein [Vibrio parahaemolyticus AQ3810]